MFVAVYLMSDQNPADGAGSALFVPQQSTTVLAATAAVMLLLMTHQALTEPVALQRQYVNEVEHQHQTCCQLSSA
jgi:hypothetical protein